jgi:hypothetical protein
MTGPITPQLAGFALVDTIGQILKDRGLASRVEDRDRVGYTRELLTVPPPSASDSLDKFLGRISDNLTALIERISLWDEELVFLHVHHVPGDSGCWRLVCRDNRACIGMALAILENEWQLVLYWKRRPLLHRHIRRERNLNHLIEYEENNV